MPDFGTKHSICMHNRYFFQKAFELIYGGVITHRYIFNILYTLLNPFYER